MSLSLQSPTDSGSSIGVQNEIHAGNGVDSPGLVSISTSQMKDTRWRRARIKLIRAADELAKDLQQGGFRYRAAFITLTYPVSEQSIEGNLQWDPKHVTVYIDAVSKWLKRRGIVPRYLWKLELTNCCVVHYHVIWFLPRGVTLPKPDKQGHWKHGLSRAEWGRRPVGYLAKYCSKTERNGWAVPKGARLFGIGGLTKLQREKISWYVAPMWLQDLVPEGTPVKKHSDGWWENLNNGWGYQTPWIYRGIGVEGLVIEWVGFHQENIYIPDGRACPPWHAQSTN